jgi:hypothetical protein
LGARKKWELLLMIFKREKIRAWGLEEILEVDERGNVSQTRNTA